jgi:hypothetical protein
MKIEKKPDGSVTITMSKLEGVKFTDDLIETDRHFDLDSFFEDSANSIRAMVDLFDMDSGGEIDILEPKQEEEL